MSCVVETQTVSQLLDTTGCGCDSHRISDNRDWCQHCEADPDECCGSGCPVGELDNRQAELLPGSSEWLEIVG